MPTAMRTNFLEFVAIESQQFMTTLANFREEFSTFSHLEGLYQAALSCRETSPRNAIIHQLLTFTHYHLYFATSCFMRCHLSEALSSTRIAIDAALVAYTIIGDRDAQTAYMSRKKPFDKLVRHYRNIIRERKPTSAFLPFLIKRHDFCSQHASHADIDVFAYRASLIREPESKLFVSYFQFPRAPEEMSKTMYQLIRDFAVILDVFSPFLVDEANIVPASWRDELHRLVNAIENRIQSGAS